MIAAGVGTSVMVTLVVPFALAGAVPVVFALDPFLDLEHSALVVVPICPVVQHFPLAFAALVAVVLWVFGREAIHQPSHSAAVTTSLASSLSFSSSTPSLPASVMNCSISLQESLRESESPPFST